MESERVEWQTKKPEPRVVNSQPNVFHITRIGCHRYAKDFLRVAVSFEPALRSGLLPVPYYLWCRHVTN